MKTYVLPTNLRQRADRAVRVMLREDQRQASARARFIELAAAIGLVRAAALLAELKSPRRASKLARRRSPSGR